MKKILIINGHPDTESFNYALHHAYKTGAEMAAIEVQEILLTTLQFNPNLQYGYRKRTELEPDLLEAWNKIKWADHIVWIFPQWWGMMPALMKGFIDRLFLPGFAFKYRTNSDLWDKLLKGKTAHIICTTDYPTWYLKLFLAEGGIKVMRKMILDFCGIKTKRTTYIGPVRPSKDDARKKWLQHVNELGRLGR